MKLFHYQPINKNTLQNLIIQKLWASDPKTYNDPFEFLMRENYRITSSGQIEYLSPELQQVWNDIKKWSSKFGVVAFSSNDENILLWSHYTFNHEGMCLVFDVKEPFPENLFKVIYADYISEPEQHNEIDYLKYLVTKNKCWHYEQEYRLIFAAGAGHCDYPGQLSEIVFGCRTSSKDIQCIFKICDSMFEKEIIFSKYATDPNTFSLSKNTIYRNKGDVIPKFWL